MIVSRNVKSGDVAQVILRFVAALPVGGCGGAAFHALGAPLPWLLGSMVACAAGAIIGLPIQASAGARRPMAAVIGVVLGSAFHPGLFDHIAAWVVTIALLLTTATSPSAPTASR